MIKTTKRNVVVSAILAITLCVSLIAGGTFALFTSESKVNVAVTSGKVDVVANMQDLTLYSPTSIDLGGNITDATNAATATTFANGGTAEFDGNSLTLTNVVPGDKATFKIVVKNNSNVTIKYRSILSCETNNGLFEGIKVIFDGTEYNGQTRVSEYQILAAGSPDMTIPVSIELPANAGNEYQDKTLKFTYKVEAVQSNAETQDPHAGVYYIYTPTDLVNLRYFAAGVNNVELKNDIDMSGVEYSAWDLNIPASATFTFDGKGYSIKNLTTTGYTGDPENSAHFIRAGLIANVASAATSSEANLGTIIFQNLTMDNATVSNTADSDNVCAAALIGCANFVNVQVNDCSVINSHITSGKYAAGFVGYSQEGDFYENVSISVTNATIEDNEIVGNGHAAGLVGLANKTVSVDAATIKGNIISTKFGHSAAAILGTGSVQATNIVASDNTYAGGLKDCDGDTEDDTFGIYHKQCGDYTVDGTGENNTIVNAYIILSLNDLKDFRDTVNAGNSFLQYTVGLTGTTVPHNVLLFEDIDLKNEEWTPIGTFANPFMGDFDGQGHTISNLKITSGTNVGLFGQITIKGGVNYLPGIFNLTLKNVTIKADGSGAFVGNSYVTTQNAGNGGTLMLSNLKLTGNVKIEGKDVGGIMGTEWTDFQVGGINITVDVNAGSYVKGTGVIGGVFASTPHGHVNNIKSNIDVIASGAEVAAGGIVGSAGWELGYSDDTATGYIICSGNVIATDVQETANGKYKIGKIVGQEANNPYWNGYNNPQSGSFFKNFTANNTISITLTNGTVLTSNGMTAEDRHGAENAVDYAQSLVGLALWDWEI